MTPVANAAPHLRADLEVARAASAGGHLPPLLVAAERVAATVAQGVHGRRRPGQGDSFWQFRPLLAGEPASRIDWRQSARSGRAYVRQTEWEAAQTVALWHAADAGMDWRSHPSLPTKGERARLLLLALAALLLRGGEQVRLLGRPGAPFTGRAGLHRLAETLGGANPAANAAGVPRYGSVVLFGDWLQPADETRRLLAGFAGVPVRGELVQVLDPAEVELPYAGRVRFAEIAAGGPSAVIGRVETVRDTYRSRLAAHQDELMELCRAAGFGWRLHRTDHPPQTALLALHLALSPSRAATR